MSFGRLVFKYDNKRYEKLIFALSNEIKRGEINSQEASIRLILKSQRNHERIVKYKEVIWQEKERQHILWHNFLNNGRKILDTFYILWKHDHGIHSLKVCLKNYGAIHRRKIVLHRQDRLTVFEKDIHQVGFPL